MHWSLSVHRALQDASLAMAATARMLSETPLHANTSRNSAVQTESVSSLGSYLSDDADVRSERTELLVSDSDIADNVEQQQQQQHASAMDVDALPDLSASINSSGELQFADQSGTHTSSLQGDASNSSSLSWRAEKGNNGAAETNTGDVTQQQTQQQQHSVLDVSH